jgi:hypothetical protein
MSFIERFDNKPYDIRNLKRDIKFLNAIYAQVHPMCTHDSIVIQEWKLELALYASYGYRRIFGTEDKPVLPRYTPRNKREFNKIARKADVICSYLKMYNNIIIINKKKPTPSNRSR